MIDTHQDIDKLLTQYEVENISHYREHGLTLLTTVTFKRKPASE